MSNFTKRAYHYNVSTYGLYRIYSPINGKFIGEVAYNRKKNNLYWANSQSFATLEDAKAYLINEDKNAN